MSTLGRNLYFYWDKYYTFSPFIQHVINQKKKMMKIFKAIFLENRNFNFKIKLPIIVRVDRKQKKTPRNICKRTLDKGFERD